MEYVTIKRAAELLGVSRPTVYKMIADGALQVREFVGRPGISVGQIERIDKRNGHKGRPRKAKS